MASRTYIPTLVLILRTVCNYITRYRNQLDGFLNTDEKKAALAAVASACEAFTLLVDIDTAP